MENPRRWTVAAIITYLSLQGSTVLCQNVSPEGYSTNVMLRDNRDYPRVSSNPTSTDILNSIYTMAASNGMIPELLPMFQGQSAIDNYQKYPYNHEALVQPLSVVPMPTSGFLNTQEPSVYFPSQSTFNPSNPNVIVATAPSPPSGSGSPPNALPSVSQNIPPALNQPNYIPQITQVVQYDNYPACAQNPLRPTPIVLQPQCQYNEVNPYNVYPQILEPITFPEVKTQPLNLAITPPPQVLPAINTYSGNFEISPNGISPCLAQPTVLTSEYQHGPLSLQINVPTPTIPPPKITVVSASPQNTPVPAQAPSYPEFPLNNPSLQYPPQPPIIVAGSSKSSWRNLLPIILVALLSDRGGNNGCCCCSCKGDGGNNIPIPYPIPIPVNNPIINSCSFPYSSHRESRDKGGYEDENKKRK